MATSKKTTKTEEVNEEATQVDAVNEEATKPDEVSEAPAQESGESAQELGFVAYKTAAKHSAMFDILIKGQTISGQWGNNREFILFMVPVELTEAFEQHWHFTSGNVIKAD